MLKKRPLIVTGSRLVSWPVSPKGWLSLPGDGDVGLFPAVALVNQWV